MVKTLLKLIQEIQDTSETGINTANLRLSQKTEAFFRDNPDIEVVSASYSASFYQSDNDVGVEELISGEPIRKSDRFLYTFSIVYRDK